MKKLLILLISSAAFLGIAKGQLCNNWLYTPSVYSTVSVGNLAVQGNQLTVEAMINRTLPYILGSTDNSDGDIVSKHNTPADVNYLLRPNNAAITTSDGFFITPNICTLEINKTYHVAMVYDGSMLKFYRNGYLMSQIAATGDLIQNNWNTKFGLYDPSFWRTQFVGYINEVRIWNVARTQQQLNDYLNTALPMPTTQVGLLGYYAFDNLLNKQGNAMYNGILSGNAAINKTNPLCNFLKDSCAKISIAGSIGNIINTYTPVITLAACSNKITVEDASAFKIGDTVLIMQMKGVVIDSSNTTLFGTIKNYNNAGNYEFNYVKNRAGNEIELLDSLNNTYDIPFGKVQLIRVPYFKSAIIDTLLTCLPWDGNKGGVLVLNVKDTINLQANIDVSGRGYAGGNSPNTGSAKLMCFYNDYNYPAGTVPAAAKGEGLALISDNISWGKGAPANAGGGGLGHNSGGGGGSNGAGGGFGGYQLEPCGNAPFDNRGIGGKALTYSNAQNKVFMGGGGGSGHTDNPGGSNMDGGKGGGIIIMHSAFIQSNGFNILAKGGDAPQCSNAIMNCHDGNGGGGGGGAILISNPNYIDATQLNCTGGKGGDLVIFNNGNAARVGPGGGGGAGITWLSNTTLPAAVTTVLTGGVNGVIISDNNNPWGTTPGGAGISLFNLQLPIASKNFNKNAGTLSIKDSSINCNIVNLSPLTNNKYTANQWQWNFGDNTTANSQSITHRFATTGLYKISLLVTDSIGCMDSASTIITATVVKRISDTLICRNTGVQLWASGGSVYRWSPTNTISDSTIANPVASPLINTIYQVEVKGTDGCSTKDSVNIAVRPAAIFAVSTPDTTCYDKAIQLMASGGDNYLWKPAVAVTNANIAAPLSATNTNTAYTVLIKESTCNTSATLSTSVTVFPVPVINISKSNDISCVINTTQLIASGAIVYAWLPAAGLSNGAIANPVASPLITTNYTVTGTDPITKCATTNNVTVMVSKDGEPKFFIPMAFSPNGDGLNDCFKVTHLNYLKSVEIAIYNRFGVLVFHTTTDNDCWDGTYLGNHCDPGNYIYTIKTQNNCAFFVKNGNLVLIR